MLDDLDLSSLVPNLSLSDLFGGTGLTIPSASSHLRITRPSGVSFDVNLTGALTVQDFLDKINLAAGFDMASISFGGLRLADQAPGLGSLTIAGLNGFNVGSLFGTLSESARTDRFGSQSGRRHRSACWTVLPPRSR